MKKTPQRQDVEERLKNIFLNRFGIRKEFWNRKNSEKHLLSREIGFLPSDLLHLFFDVEEALGKKIPQQFVIEEKFSSFNNIVEIIQAVEQTKDLRR